MPTESGRRRAARQGTAISPGSVATSTQQEIRDFLPTLVEGGLTATEEFVTINDLQLYTGAARNVACPLEGELAAKLKTLVAEAMKTGSKGKDSQEVKRSKDELRDEKKKFTHRMFEEELSSIRPCDYCLEKNQPCTVGVYDEETKGRDSKAITILLYCSTCQHAHKACSLLERYMAARLASTTGWKPHVAYSLIRALRADRRKPSKKKGQLQVEEVTSEDPLPDEQAEEKSQELESTSPKRGGSSTRKRARVISDDFNPDGKPESLDVRKSKRPSLASSAVSSKPEGPSTNGTSTPTSSGEAPSFVTKSALKAISAEKMATQVETTEPKFSMPPRVRKTAHLRNLGLTPDPFVEMELDATPDNATNEAPEPPTTTNSSGNGNDSTAFPTTEPSPQNISTTLGLRLMEEEEELEVQPPPQVQSSPGMELLKANEEALSRALEASKANIELLTEELQSLKMKEDNLRILVDEAQARLAKGDERTVVKAEQDERLHSLLTELLRGSQDACSMLSTFDPGAASSANPNLLHGEVVSRLRKLVDRTSANIGYL